MTKIKEFAIDEMNSARERAGWCAALVAAQKQMKPVTKDSTNAFHRYQYASAEDVITAARAALNGAGLALVRSWRIESNEIGIWLHSHFQLIFESSPMPIDLGDSSNAFPIIEDKGRPLDKALAGALTTSLAYYLRDLLLIPKQDENQVDKRDDTRHIPQAVIGLSGAVSIKKKLKAANKSLDELAAAMRGAGLNPPDDLAQWLPTWLPRVNAWIEKKLASSVMQAIVAVANDADTETADEVAGLDPSTNKFME